MPLCTMRILYECGRDTWVIVIISCAVYMYTVDIMPILVVLYNYFTSLWFDLFSFVTNNTLLHRKIKIPPYEIWCIRIQFLGVENENIRMIINMSVYCEQVPSSHDEYLKKKKNNANMIGANGIRESFKTT